MAPRITSVVSSSVDPAATHPGRSGTCALYVPKYKLKNLALLVIFTLRCRFYFALQITMARNVRLNDFPSAKLKLALLVILTLHRNVKDTCKLEDTEQQLHKGGDRKGRRDAGRENPSPPQKLSTSTGANIRDSNGHHNSGARTSERQRRVGEPNNRRDMRNAGLPGTNSHSQS